MLHKFIRITKTFFTLFDAMYLYLGQKQSLVVRDLNTLRQINWKNILVIREALQM